jgi:phasin family protein
MSKQAPFSNLFQNPEFSKMFENFRAMPFDVQSLMETQRKNIQAMTEAQQMAIESFQAIVQRQSEMLSQIVEENSKITTQIMGEGTPEEKIAKQADLFKGLYERSVKNMNDLTDMVSNTNQEASKIITKRVSASITEIKSSLVEKQQQKKAA